MQLQRIILEPESEIILNSYSSIFISRVITKMLHELYEDPTDIINKFVTSDLLPYVVNQPENIYLIPKPKLPLQNELDVTKLKQYKKVKYIDINLLADYDAVLNNLLTPNETPKYTIKNGIILKKNTNIKFSISKIDRPHNLVLREKQISENGKNVNSTGEIFYLESSKYNNTGLYFYLYTDDEDTNKKIHAALHLLEDRGIGKKVNVGYGKFKYIRSENIEIMDVNTKGMLLSSWIPCEDDVNNNIIPQYYSIETYQPINITNFSYTEPLHKVRYLTSGSIIKNPNNIIGNNEIISEHNVIFGKSIVIGGIK